MRSPLVLLVVLGWLAPLAGAQVFTDDFTYPKGPTIGRWNQDRGVWQATGQEAQAQDSFLWQYLTLPNLLYQDCAAECTVLYNPSATNKLQFGGVALRVNDGKNDSDLVMVKVQDNDSSGDFDSIWLYARPSGSTSKTSIPGFLKARVRLAVLDTTAVAFVDDNMDGTWDHTLRLALTMTVKPGPAGVDGFGGVLIDDFAFFDGVILDDPTSPAPTPGAEVPLKLRGFPNGPYQAATSLGKSGIVLYDGRIIPLTTDSVLVASVTNTLPMIFKNYRGVCSSSGDATIRIAIPNIPVLKGITLYTAFANYSTSSLLNISNEHAVTLQ
ncbi:MAG: hypothetical protein JXQ29_15430 [Planctomycetes bacterium]|nr:hypothetical protein [Planctomycetota bacterium]